MRAPRVIAIAFCTGAAWPALAAAQHVPSLARPHPAASAHANALAGATSAVRIEACTLATRRMLEHLERGDPEGAMANFDAQLRGALTAAQLGALWRSIGAKLGAVTRRKPVQNMLYDDRVVVTEPLEFERGTLAVELACNADGQFASLRLRPLAATGDDAVSP